jgi:protein-S-isoprenylcysteine O-methyltransferase Ste14
MVMTSSDQPIVDSDPYRVLRYPSYAGAVLTFSGAGLADGNWLCLAAMILLPLAGIIDPINVEEAALRGSLGDAYESFVSTRKRLVLFSW